MAEPANIVVAEDLENDVLILQRSFERAGVKVPLHFARNGQETIDYLRGEGRFADREKHPLPTLLLLDLKMPGVDGFEVLQWVRAHGGLRRLPVIVFTSSQLPQDINRSYDLGANSYLVKPVGFKAMEEQALLLEKYWLGVNHCPECRLPSSRTRVLLRNIETGLFFKNPKDWTRRPDLATDFGSAEDADRAAAALGLTNMEAFLEKDSEPMMGVRLPLLEGPGTPPTAELG